MNLHPQKNKFSPQNSLNLSNNQIAIYGIHPCFCAIKNMSRKIYRILATKNVSEKLIEQLNTYRPELINQIKYVDNNYLNSKLPMDCNHQGIIMVISPIKTMSIEDFLNKNKENPELRIALLDQVTDSRNIGAIIRSAVAFNIDAILTTTHDMPSENANMVKSSAGGIESISIITISNLKNAIDLLKKNGFWITGMDAHTFTDIENLDYFPKLGIIFGSEGKGMRKLTKEACDFLIKIPMNSAKIESLNISNAAAITFYEIQKNSKTNIPTD